MKLNFYHGIPAIAIGAALIVLGSAGQAAAQSPPAVDQAASSARQLTLEQVLEQVEERNESWEIAEARIEQARGARRQALAGLLPQLSAQANLTRNGQEIAFGGSNVQSRYDWGVSGRASLVLFNGALYPMLSRAGTLLDAAEAQAVWQRRSIKLEATEAFYLLAAAQARLAIAEQTVELREAQLERAEALLEAKLGVKLDVEIARSQLFEARQDVLEAESMRGNADDALGTLLALDPDTALSTDLGEEALAEVQLEQPPAEAEHQRLEERADFKASRLQIEAVELNKKSVWAQFLPTIDLGANANFGPPRAFSNPDGFGWALTLSASWLLYDGGARYGQLQQLEGQLQETSLEYQRELREARAGMRRALRAWQTATAGVDVARQQVESAGQAYESASARFENGLITSIDLADASERLFQAEVSLNQRVLDARIAAAEYRYLSGLMGQD